MRLARPRPVGDLTLAAVDPGISSVLATCCSPGRVGVSRRSNALSDRYATGTPGLKVSPMAGKRAGQRAMRLM
jgi:hypothetical protein